MVKSIGSGHHLRQPRHCLWRLGRCEAAKRIVGARLSYSRAPLWQRASEVAITLVNLGNAYGDLGDAKQKKELLERALVIDERHYGKEHPEVAHHLR